MFDEIKTIVKKQRDVVQFRSERLHGAETKKVSCGKFFSFRVVTVNERASAEASRRECYGNYDRSEVVELNISETYEARQEVGRLLAQ